MNEETRHLGIGRRMRRQMIARWKLEGKPLGLSLKQWARAQSPVGDAAHWWLVAKVNNNRK